MRYWWVNQNRTYRQEVRGGYLWSPKLRQNGSTNPFYEFMREVAPGDLVFSFADRRIRALGMAISFAYEAPQPPEFGSAGRNWDRIGWRVDVHFEELQHVVRPVDWIDNLRHLLPPRYAPLDQHGRGSQSVYLTELPAPFALALADLVGTEAGALARGELVAERANEIARPDLLMWEEHLRQEIEADPNLPATDLSLLVLPPIAARRHRSRRGPKENVHDANYRGGLPVRRCALSNPGRTDRQRDLPVPKLPQGFGRRDRAVASCSHP